VHQKSEDLCQVATVRVIVDDFNDHSPQFVRKNYNFRIDRFPYNNTEIGTLLATDEDKVLFPPHLHLMSFHMMSLKIGIFWTSSL
jgi:hypothetical protein